MALTRYADPAAFLDEARPLLASDPARTTIIGSSLHQVLDGTFPDDGSAPPWFATVTDPGGVVTGLAMRVGSYPPLMHGFAPDEAAALAALILGDGEAVGAVTGEERAARAFAARVTGTRGGRVEVERGIRLHRLESLRPPDGVPGRGRPAAATDLDLTTGWVLAFLEEIGEGERASTEPGRAQQRDLQRTRLPRTWLWVDEHEIPVSLAAASEPAFGVARIGPVYTPPEHRERGYAAAVTAHLSAVLRAAGSDVVLFTDLANPTSNGVYARIGYRPVADRVTLRIVDD